MERAHLQRLAVLSLNHGSGNRVVLRIDHSSLHDAQLVIFDCFLKRKNSGAEQIRTRARISFATSPYTPLCLHWLDAVSGKWF